MICIKANIPKELNYIDYELKADQETIYQKY
jgi:hypothetical protein